jgi:hypothetical protein
LAFIHATIEARLISPRQRRYPASPAFDGVLVDAVHRHETDAIARRPMIPKAFHQACWDHRIWLFHKMPDRAAHCRPEDGLRPDLRLIRSKSPMDSSIKGIGAGRLGRFLRFPLTYNVREVPIDALTLVRNPMLIPTVVLRFPGLQDDYFRQPCPESIQPSACHMPSL